MGQENMSRRWGSWGTGKAGISGRIRSLKWDAAAPNRLLPGTAPAIPDP
jgi:hypothetical protein